MELESPYGHDAFLIEETTLSAVVNPFLKRTREHSG
jgi:homoserine acetyltransferase